MMHAPNTVVDPGSARGVMAGAEPEPTRVRGGRRNDGVAAASSEWAPLVGGPTEF